MVVLVEDVDVARAGLVRRPGERLGERSVLDEGADLHVLPRLEVEPDADDQTRVGLETVTFHHNGEP